MERPKVGVGVFVFKDGKILLGKRKGSHGEGSWAPPGGHLEYRETFQQCAEREIHEETGLIVRVRKGLSICTNDIFPDKDKHYVTIFVKTDYQSGVPETKEPDKCERWDWFNWENLPEPLFLPIQHLKEQGYNPFD